MRMESWGAISGKSQTAEMQNDLSGCEWGNEYHIWLSFSNRNQIPALYKLPNTSLRHVYSCLCVLPLTLVGYTHRHSWSYVRNTFCSWKLHLKVPYAKTCCLGWTRARKILLNSNSWRKHCWEETNSDNHTIFSCGIERSGEVWMKTGPKFLVSNR